MIAAPSRERSGARPRSSANNAAVPPPDAAMYMPQLACKGGADQEKGSMAAGRLSTIFATFAFLALATEDGRAQQYSVVGNWEANVTLNGLPITSDATLRQDG